MKVKIFIILVLLKLLSFPVFGAEEYTVDEFDVKSIIDAVPREVRENLPEEIFSAEKFSDNFSFEYFFSFLKNTLSSSLTPALKNFTGTLGVVLIAAALSAMKGVFKSDALVSMFEILSGLCILLSVYQTAFSLVERVGKFLSQLGTVMTAMIPVMAAVGTAGGNVSASAASAGGAMIGVSLVSVLASSGLFPILKLCFGISVCSGIGSGLRLDGISKLIRNAFTWLIGFLAAAISAVMTFQTSIAAHADSLSMRALKFAASNAVPVAGGIASEAVAAVAGSLSIIKGSVGWAGVIILLIMTLPLTADILLIRLGISASSVAADIIGLEREKRILDEMCGLLGFLAAISVICTLMFVYALALFAKSATALGGV